MPPIRTLKRSLIHCRIKARAVWRSLKRAYVQAHIWCLNLLYRIHGWIGRHVVHLLFAFLAAALAAILLFQPCIDRLVQESGFASSQSDIGQLGSERWLHLFGAHGFAYPRPLHGNDVNYTVLLHTF